MQSSAALDGVGGVRISWQSIPGQSYSLQTTTNLASQWGPVANSPTPMVATTNALSQAVPIEGQARFFKVTELDTDPPVVERLSPAAGGIGVGLQQPIRVFLWDETGIDTNSVRLTVGSGAAVTLADPRLTFTNSVLTYRPAGVETLGQVGETVALTLSVADTLGQRRDGYAWSLELEKPLVLADRVSRPPGRPGLTRPLSSRRPTSKAV